MMSQAIVLPLAKQYEWQDQYMATETLILKELEMLHRIKISIH